MATIEELYARVQERHEWREALERSRGQCQCGVCRLFSGVERLKEQVDDEGKALLEHLGNSIADAETEAEMHRYHIMDATGKPYIDADDATRIRAALGLTERAHR